MTLARRRAKPRRATVPILSSAGAIAAWLVVAHGSGAGWVQTIGALVTGALVVGLVGPAIAVQLVTVRVVSSPADAIAGAPTTLQVSLSAPGEVRPVRPPGPTALSGRAPIVTLEVVPARRGVVETCTLEVASAAPFGLCWWTRVLTVPLPRPMAVAPRAGDLSPAVPDTLLDPCEATGASGRSTMTRGARPYEPGDARRLVHWPLSAHSGRLMVRETDRRSPRTVVVDGFLPDDPIAADVHAGRVLATVLQLLGQGCRVQLRTVEPGGVVLGAVEGAATAERQLACALPRDDDQ